jgi:hypothetical protein
VRWPISQGPCDFLPTVPIVRCPLQNPYHRMNKNSSANPPGDSEPGERYANCVISTGETLYVAPEILQLLKEGVSIENLFVENHSRGDCGIYGETLEEIAAHLARIEDEKVNPPIISAHPLPEHGMIVIFLTDRINQITHVFGLKMERCGNLKYA